MEDRNSFLVFIIYPGFYIRFQSAENTEISENQYIPCPLSCDELEAI